MITRRKSQMLTGTLTTSDSGAKGRGRYTFDSGTSSGGGGGLKVPTGNTLSFAEGSLIEFYRKNDRIQGPGLVQLNGKACRPIEVRPHKDNPDGHFAGFWPADCPDFFNMDPPDSGDYIFRFCRFISCHKDIAYNDGHVGLKGGAIGVYRCENIIIEDCYFKDCRVENVNGQGGAVYINSLNPLIDPPGTSWSLNRNKFRDCFAQLVGGGFWLSHNSGDDQLIDCFFERCEMGSGVLSTANTTNNTMSYDASAINAKAPIDGSQCRFTTTGTLPSPLQAGVTYFITNAILDTSVQLCETIEDALAGTNIIDISDTGSGTHTIYPFSDVGHFEQASLELIYT